MIKPKHRWANPNRRLRAIYENRRNKTLYIAGHGSLRYGEIVAVIDASKGAGVDRVGTVTDAVRRGTRY